jgi:hypothetical protein
MIWSKERNLGFYNRDLYNSSLYRAVIDGSARLTPHEMDSLRKSKTKSFLEHFLYNLLATEQIVSPIEHLLNEEQKKFIESRKESLSREILKMIEFIEGPKT